MTKRWIPNILTTINLFAGVVSLFSAFTGQFFLALVLILGAALFDSLDGRIARRLNVTSEFGKQLDSLADLTSFGIAPAAMDFLLNFAHVGWNGYVLVTVFPICGALRLARFSITNMRGYYLGLPITAAGPLLAAAAYLGQALPVAGQVFILVVLSALMISTIKVPKI